MGRKDAPGRPLLYGTTTEFLRYFGLNDIKELPPIDIDTSDAGLILPTRRDGAAEGEASGA